MLQHEGMQEKNGYFSGVAAAARTALVDFQSNSRWWFLLIKFLMAEPGYLRDIVCLNVSACPVQSGRMSMFQVPYIKRCHLTWLWKCVFSIKAPALWSNIPSEIQTRVPKSCLDLTVASALGLMCLCDPSLV